MEVIKRDERRERERGTMIKGTRVAYRREEDGHSTHVGDGAYSEKTKTIDRGIRVAPAKGHVKRAPTEFIAYFLV